MAHNGDVGVQLWVVEEKWKDKSQVFGKDEREGVANNKDGCVQLWGEEKKGNKCHGYLVSSKDERDMGIQLLEEAMEWKLCHGYQVRTGEAW